MIRLKATFAILTISTIGWCVSGCGSKSEPTTNAPEGTNSASNMPKPNNVKESLKKADATAKKPEASKIKGFDFNPPSPDWIETKQPQGDGTYTQATYQAKTGGTAMSVTSISLPAKGAKATDLVKKCETEFAQGIAKHPEMAREWIKSGFSISRYADSTNGTVSVWCISDLCKVQLKFAFDKASNMADNVKTSDSLTDSFFDANPTGGAKTN